jgi:hypothetical protein
VAADVQGSDRAARTKEHYTYCVDRYVLPRIGSLRVSEVDTGVCDLLLKDLAGRSRSAAKSTRAVLNGLFRLAVASGAASANPVRETSSIGGQRSLARALTTDEANSSPTGSAPTLEPCHRHPTTRKGLDLADLVDLMLATGCRIGEALACRHMPNADGLPLLDLGGGDVGNQRHRRTHQRQGVDGAGTPEVRGPSMTQDVYLGGTSSAPTPPRY